MSVQDELKHAAIDIIEACGYIPNGSTRVEHVRIPTANAPGGNRRTIGGRMRFSLEEQRVTVGAITTCFYAVIGGKTRDATNVPTRDTDDVLRLAVERSDMTGATTRIKTLASEYGKRVTPAERLRLREVSRSSPWKAPEFDAMAELTERLRIDAAALKITIEQLAAILVMHGVG